MSDPVHPPSSDKNKINPIVIGILVIVFIFSGVIAYLATQLESLIFTLGNLFFTIELHKATILLGIALSLAIWVIKKK